MRLIAIFIALAVLVVIPFLIWGDAFETLFAQQAAVEWLHNAGPWAALAAVGLLIIDVFLPVPATSIMAALGIVFGPLAGGSIGAVGSFLSGSLAYGLCRAFGESLAHRLLGERDYRRGEQLFAHIGVWFVMLSRWLPILPEVIACMAGLVRMRARLFFMALACGCIPMAFTFAWVGHLGSGQPAVTLGACAVLPPLLYVIARYLMKRLRLAASDTPQER